MADVYEQSLQLHKENRGKMEIKELLVTARY